MRDKIHLIHRINIMVKSKGGKAENAFLSANSVLYTKYLNCLEGSLNNLSLVTVYLVCFNKKRTKPDERNSKKGQSSALVLKVAQALIIKENFLWWCCKGKFSMQVK